MILLSNKQFHSKYSISLFLIIQMSYLFIRYQFHFEMHIGIE